MAQLALSVADRAYVLQSGAFTIPAPLGGCAGSRTGEGVSRRPRGAVVSEGLEGEGMMDLILRNARPMGAEQTLTDIGIAGGKIAAIEPRLAAEGEQIDLGGRLVSPGFVETHIHLDKSCILDRGQVGERRPRRGDRAKSPRPSRRSLAEDVHARAPARWKRRSCKAPLICARIWKSIPASACAARRRPAAHRASTPGRSICEICVFPQEGLLNNPGTDELMVEASIAVPSGRRRAYVDSDPPGQIDRVFELAREYDIDVDMHLDFGPTADGMDLDYVCERTEDTRWRPGRHRACHEAVGKPAVRSSRRQRSGWPMQASR